MRNWNKVFEVGSDKTGTSSLRIAFDLLGLDNVGFRGDLYLPALEGDYEPAFAVADEHQAFQNHPWHSLPVDMLDQRYPNSKFILLEREIEDWIASYEQHYSSESHKKKVLPELVIADFATKKAGIIQEHLDRYQRVKDYFVDRPDDLLVMDICAGEGWEKLCPFLGLDVPDAEFPWQNKTPTTSTELLLRRVRETRTSVLRKLGLR